MSVQETVNLLLAAAGAIVAIGGAAAVIKRWVAPALKLQKRVEQLERHETSDLAAIREMKEANNMTLRGILLLLDTRLHGNNEEETKQLHTEIQTYLINRN